MGTTIPAMKEIFDFLAKYFPTAKQARRLGGVRLRRSANHGEGAADVRRRPDPRQCHEAGASLKDFEAGHAFARIKINTSPTDFAPIEQLQMMRFKGEKWDLFATS